MEIILQTIPKKISNMPAFKKEVQGALQQKTSQLLELILAGAINLDASDIHFEPEEETTKMRVRVDGTLQETGSIPASIYETLLSRIKLVSGIKLNISDRPQDGRFSLLMKDSPIEVRSSSLPSEHGETIVLRILNPKSLMDIENLGLSKKLLEVFSREIKKPHGMIIVTGPTGSGKTTTLYAFLKKIQNPEIKIITIEDPIEYHLKGVSQTQVQPDKGYDFVTGLKSIIRQDPDVILIGEIRDLETAKIAIQSAMTGHLVFGTLHTNDAVGTVARLINLGAKVEDLGPAINLVVAQRLVRKICSQCKKLKKISSQDLPKLKKELNGLAKLTPQLKIPYAQGCPDCNFTGYQGRIGIFEALLLDDEIEKFILKNPSAAGLLQLAVRRGMVLMKQDGFIKVLAGLTTIDEVERVSG